MHDQDHRERLALAITLGLMLLIGCVLLVNAWAGHWMAPVVFGLPIVVAYALRRTVRRILRNPN